MNIRLLTVTLLLVCACGSATGQVTQIPATKTVPYEGWGFQVDVPRTARRVALAPGGDIDLWDLHIHGDIVYFVKVIKTSPETLTSTAIEQDIQAEANLAAKRGQTTRWEMDSAQGELFKGLNYYLKPDEDIPEAAAELRKVLRDRTGFSSTTWALLKDESGEILSVGVIGPKGRDSEIQNLAKFLVRGVKTMAAKAPVSAPATTASSPAAVAKPASAKVRPALKKGDIEIAGVVESIAPDKKSLSMKAETVTMPRAAAVKLDPVRSKIIEISALPSGVAPGVRIVVIGKNTGVGKPMIADFLEVVP